jgi:hypothetical protein
MVPQQDSANKWIEQNRKMRTKMAENDKSGTERDGEGAQPSQSEREADAADLEEARAAVEEAKQREAYERARQQERGPER